MLSNKEAFTLIELLVVVLIIGILAAVALPQYQKAVWKSRMVQHMQDLKTIYKGLEIYRLSHGSYPELQAGATVGSAAQEIIRSLDIPLSEDQNKSFLFVAGENGRLLFVRKDMHPALNVFVDFRTPGQLSCSDVTSNTDSMAKCRALCGHEVSASEGFGDDQNGCYIF